MVLFVLTYWKFFGNFWIAVLHLCLTYFSLNVHHYNISQVWLSSDFLVLRYISSTFHFAVGQNFGRFGNNDILNLLSWRFDKLLIWSASFVAIFCWLTIQVVFTLWQFSINCSDFTILFFTITGLVWNNFQIFIGIVHSSRFRWW